MIAPYWNFALNLIVSLLHSIECLLGKCGEISRYINDYLGNGGNGLKWYLSNFIGGPIFIILMVFDDILTLASMIQQIFFQNF